MRDDRGVDGGRIAVNPERLCVIGACHARRFFRAGKRRAFADLLVGRARGRLRSRSATSRDRARTSKESSFSHIYRHLVVHRVVARTAAGGSERVGIGAYCSFRLLDTPIAYAEACQCFVGRNEVAHPHTECPSADPEVIPASRLRSKEPRVEDERHVGEVGGLMPALRNDVALRFRLYDAPWPIRHTRWPGFGHLARSTTPERRRRGAARKKRNTRCARTSESLSKEPDLGPNGPRVPQRGAITHTRAVFREVPPIRAGTCTP